MEGKHNIDIAVRGINSLIDEMDEGKRAFFYVDFIAGLTNERELIDSLRTEAQKRGYSFEVEYDDGDLVIWIGERDVLKPDTEES